MSDFAARLAQLQDDLVTQGDRVVDLTLRAVESFFERDLEKAEGVIAGDAQIDRADVEIERASVPLLGMGVTNEYEIRNVLMVVKINNELERIADIGVEIAETVKDARKINHPIPDTFRVMANSVIGMLRDANRSLRDRDVNLAERVLAFDDTVDQFKRKIFLGLEKRVAEGTFPLKFAFRLRTVTAGLEQISDHCTNICEQLIYLETGRIVRHLPEGWTKPALPDV